MHFSRHAHEPDPEALQSHRQLAIRAFRKAFTRSHEREDLR
jgi:hypothetical protein